MKKTISFLLLASFFLSACQSTVIEDRSAAPVSTTGETSMQSNFSWDRELADSFLEQENVYQVSYSGPFYFGTFAGLDDYTKAYVKARDSHSDAILQVVDESIGYLNELEIQMRKERNMLDWYFLKISALAPNVREELWQKIDETNGLALLNYTKLAYLNSLRQELIKMPKSSEWGFLEYQKYYLVFSLTESYEEELISLHSKLAGLYYLLDSQNLDTYKKINQQLDQEMKPIADQQNELLHKLSFNGASLAFQEKLLFTADHYYVQDVVANIEQKLPELKKAVSDYQGGKENVTPEMLQLINDQISQYEQFVANMKIYLAGVPESELVKTTEFVLPQSPVNSGIVSFRMIPVARAGFSSTMSWLGGKISSATSTVIDVTKTGVGMAWDGTKAVVGTGVNVAVGGVKLAGKGIGTVLDTAAAVVKTPMDAVNGIYYGNSFKDVMGTMKDNYVGIYNNYHNGTQGSQVYSDTVKILDETDKLVGTAAEKLTEAAFGQGVTSKTVGFATKIVSGFFTGLTKDAVTALNPNTSKTDTLVSLLGVGMSLWGGSGSFLKGSQALKITASKTTSTVSKLISVTNSLDTAAIKEGAKNLFEGGLKGAIKKVFTKQSGEMLLEGSKTVYESTKKTLVENLKSGYTMLKDNAKKNIPEAYAGYFEKKAMSSVFADVLGIGKSAGGTITEKALSFMNNLTGSMADDKIKSWVGKAAQMFGISSKTQEELNDEEQEKLLSEVKKGLALEIDQTNKEDVKKLAEEYKTAKSKNALGPFWDWLIPKVSAVSAGNYRGNVSFSVSQYGANNSGGGVINFSVDGNNNVSCSMNLDSVVSGNVQGMSISGKVHTVSSACSGSVNPENGDYSVAGSFDNSGSVTMSGYGASKTTPAVQSVKFISNGNMKDGVVKGYIMAGQFTFNIEPIAYSEF